MRLASLTTYLCDAYRTNWVFVRLETDDGLVGWGEATLEYREHTVEAALRALEPSLAGRDLEDIQGWWQDAYRDAYWRGGAVLTSALSGIEMALWDLKGKLLGVPVHQLLGGTVRTEVECYANAWFAGARTAAEFAERARDAVEWGYRAVKWDPFGSAFRTVDRGELRSALAVVDAVAEAVGDDAGLIVEAHGRFEVPTALRVARALEPFDLLWLEEPLIPGNTAALAEVRAATSTPIGVGERLYTRWDFREVFDARAADVVQPDVSHVGGIWEARTVASLAELWQVGFAPHNPSGPIANAATLQLAACVPNFTLLETMATDVPWRADVVVSEPSITHGRAPIPTAPGLGVELDAEALTRFPYVRHDLRHYTGALTEIRPEDSVGRHEMPAPSLTGSPS
ncbi:Mandelate racemase/muconate lactonizing protein [Beutenbergia cavernae DSM 12333]|uniref:Mandelate racemase/muconate lactonizing protein n=1 Tax=Beutenbergia cavernae (strain ATCC BAA-8 / DSM 12333 / CCUG 43141 / JCM 11478 / NBRC 16432 / NCIMB 13614 / HKI 0122) TaxID=471853 RepID=C5C209_BEUC1|nr:galactonate dehydratase [Beutenbergia cavernae]ACQ81634.1 Mandelate racemase/muconate lactonizing protein [Beutenbergia cavernae DSM 12333]